MAGTDHITLTITQNSVGVARAGFGIPLILSHSAAWAERVRTYKDIAEVAADFPTTTSPEYLQAAAMFSQNPKPSKIKIGRAALKPTQSYKITPVAANNTVYKVTAAGTGFTPFEVSYTSDATATVAEITLGLTAAINGVLSNNYLATDNTTHVTVTGDAAGDWFSLEVGDPTLMKIEQIHADPGVATDLAAIQLEDPDWYALSTHFNSNAYVLAADAWVQSNKKLYVFDVNESDAITTAAGNSDTLDDIETLNRARTAGIYHPSPVSMNAAGWLGRCLPLDPGSITWKFKQITGTPSVKLTASQRANLISRNSNFFEPVYSFDMMSEGTTADGDFIDVQRGIDWIEDDMSKGVFEVLASADKIPFTDPGGVAIASAVQATLDRAVARGILASSPAPVVTVPKVADVSSANKTARNFPDVNFSGTLAGAIHKVNIKGTVSV